MSWMMLGFVRHFSPFRGRPIGVDLGATTLRLAQVDGEGADMRLVHADAIDVPANLPAGHSHSDFIVESLRRSLRSGKFGGRQISVALPASAIQVKHVRVGRGEGPEVTSQIIDQVVALLGGERADWFIRSAIAGEVSGETTPQQEAIAFATPRSTIEQLIDDAAAARVELAGVQVQPRVIAAAFGEIHRRKADVDAVNLFVDLGGAGTRAIVAAPIAIKFVRDVPVRVAELHDRMARTLAIDPASAAILRRSAIARQTGRSNEINTPETDASAGDAAVLAKLTAATEIEARRLADELELCRRYYEATFSTQPITKLIFTGGGAKDRLLCAAVAQAMALPAQIGDPLVRFNRAALPSLSCVDRRDAQPEWTVAIGLSMCAQPVGVK
jgi:Tfp pilus assembly PilM family ATPase